LTGSLGVKALPVVLDLNLKRPVGFANRDPHCFCLGVLADVREGLLHESVDGALEVTVEPRSSIDRVRQRQLAGNLQSVLLAMAVEQRLDRDLQPKLVQRCGA